MGAVHVVNFALNPARYWPINSPDRLLLKGSRICTSMHAAICFFLEYMQSLSLMLQFNLVRCKYKEETQAWSQAPGICKYFLIPRELIDTPNRSSLFDSIPW